MERVRAWGLALVIAIGASAATGAAEPPATAFDNAGVHLGDAPDTVQRLLADQHYLIDSVNRIYDAAPQDRFPASITGVKTTPAVHETVVVRFAEPPSSPRVILVWRSMRFAEGAPLVADYRRAVRDKAHGETSWRQEAGRAEQYVQWRRDGSIKRSLVNLLETASGAPTDPCVAGIAITSAAQARGISVRVPPAPNLNGDRPPGALQPPAPQSRCGVGFVARFAVPDARTDLVEQADLLLVDQPAMLEMAERRDRCLSEATRRRIEERRRAAGRPIL